MPEGVPVMAATYVRVIAYGAVNEALSTPYSANVKSTVEPILLAKLVFSIQRKYMRVSDEELRGRA